jgi:hypothetical protein
VRNPRDNSYIKTYIRFIPASYKDNPFLNASYVANLLALPEHQRKMDMYGNWDVVAGKMFDIKPDQRIHPKAVAEDLRRYEGRYEVYVSIDWGYKPSYHSAHWHAVFPDGSVITFKELYGQELIFEEFVATIRDMSRDYDIAITCLPHDMFRHGENYRDNTGRVIGETKSDVFEDAQLSPIPVESGKGKVQMRYDKIYSACELRRPDGTPKFKISEDCPMLLDELDHAVHSDIVPEEMAKGCADHAIDDYGLFLVFYSEDIEELGQEKPAPDMRSNLQRKMDEDEERLEQSENESLFVGVDSDF